MKVCFGARCAHALFDPASRAPFGGMEVRAARFAKTLARRPGFAVSFLVHDRRQPSPQLLHNVTVLAETDDDDAPVRRPCRRRRKRGTIDTVYLWFYARADRTSRFPYFRIHRWHPSLLWQLPLLAAHRLYRRAANRMRQRRHSSAVAPPVDNDAFRLQPTPALRRLDCDAFCCFGVNATTAHDIAACQQRGIPTVLFVAHDDDLSAHYYPGSRYLGQHHEPGNLCHYALTHADRIVVQTESQRQLLAERFQRDGVLIRNPLPQAPAPAAPIPPHEQFVLWIGRAEKAYKRPELALELARHTGEIPFVMIMNRGYQGLYDLLVSWAPSNVRIVERVPFAEIDAYFHRARVFLSTSRSEGFPNTFLQAASHGVPIVSLDVDPDGFLSREQCGLVAGGELRAAADAIHRFWSQPELARACGAAGRRYVATAHDLEGRVDQLVALLDGLAPARRRGRDAARADDGFVKELMQRGAATTSF